jgi:hypothetical protein
VASEPTEEELRAFIRSMLSSLDRQLREREVIDEALHSHREMWELIYRASQGLDPGDTRS